MIVTRARFREALDRVSDKNLSSLVHALVAFNDNNVRDGGHIPWRDMEKILDDYGDRCPETEGPYFNSRSDDEIRAAISGEAKGESRRPQANVRLEKIVVKNFGSYRSDSTLELNPLANRNVTVVVAGNGEGKSTLFDAINWALFGDEYLNEMLKVKGKNRKDIINFRAVDDLKANGGQIETSVVLWFKVQGDTYYVIRKFSSTVLDNGELSPGVTSTSLFQVTIEGNHQPMDPDRIPSLLSGLPSQVKDFYLFDGERINRFASPGSQQAVMQAIRQILGVQGLERAQENIEGLAKRFRRAYSNKAPNESKALVDAAEAKREEISAAEAEIAETKDSIGQLASMIKALEDRLRSAPDTSDLQRRRDELEQQHAEIYGRRLAHGKAMRKGMARALTALAAPAVDSLAENLGNLKEKGEIPGHISVQLIKELLERGTCICGRDLNDHENAAAHLVAELEKANQMDGMRSALLSVHASLGFVAERSVEAVNSVREANQGYWVETAQLEENDALREGVTISLRGAEQNDHQSWESERAAKNDQLVQAKMRLSQLEQSIKAMADELKSLEKQVLEAAEKGQEAAELNRKSIWSAAAAEALEGIIHEFATIARLDVEARTGKLWHELLPNTEQYGVEVSPEFELIVQTQGGTSGLAQLSMGQQQCLGLAFITSVAQASETLPPLVIDMPFGRLDTDVAASVARAMPSLTVQLVLFLLNGTEWNDYTQPALEPAIARVARLTVDKQTKDTTINTEQVQFTA